MKRLFVLFLFLLVFALSAYAEENTEQAQIRDQAKEGTRISSQGITIIGEREQPGVVTILDKSDVDNSTRTDLVNVIKEHVPSFYTPNNRIMGFGVSSSGAAEMSIRGIGISGWGPTTGLPFLINGMDTTTSIMGHPVADIFTMKNVDRIEVLHGPQPVLYGSGAMGGVVNIITKRQQVDGYSTELSGSYGSRNSTDDYMIHRGKIGAFDYGVSYNFQRTDGSRSQTTPNGTEVTSEYYNHNGTAHFGFEMGQNWYAGVDSYIMKEKIHDPGADGAPTNSLEVFDIVREGASLNLLNHYDMINGSIQLFYNGGKHQANQPATGLDSYEQTDSLYGARMVEAVKLFTGNTITVGVDARRWGGTAKNPDNTTIPWLLANDNYYVKDKFLSEGSVFGLLEQKLFGILTVSGGVRYTNNSEFGGFTSWQGGIVLNPFEGTKIHATVARGFKLPDLRQLYLRGPYPVLNPNPDLKAETYLSYEAGIEQKLFSSLDMYITGYRIYSDNKIGATGSFPSSATWVNLDEFNYNGLEAGFKYELMRMIGLRTGYSYIDNEYQDRWLPYVPEHRLVGEISFYGYGIYVACESNYLKNVYSDTQGTVKLSNYTVFNVKLAYTFLQRYRAFLNLNNITDREYETYAGYPMPGFNALGGFSVTF